MIVCLQKCLSSTKNNNKKFILKSIHLCKNITKIHYINAILKLIQVFWTFQELRDVPTLYGSEICIMLIMLVIAFRDTGDAVCNDISYTYHMIGMYNGDPFLFSFFICLYNTCYTASLVINMRNVS